MIAIDLDDRVTAPRQRPDDRVQQRIGIDQEITTEVLSDDSAIGVMCTDVFGKGWSRFRIAHLATGNRIGVEIFEFENVEKPANNFEYWKTGVFHFSVQDPDVEGLAKRIVDTGGKQRMQVRNNRTVCV